MSKTTLPLADAQIVAQKLIDVLQPACERIEIAGSIRREKPTVGDIEIVAIPKVYQTRQLDLFGQEQHAGARRSRLDDVLDQLIAEEKIWREPPSGARPAWGERMKKFWLQVEKGTIAQVDLFIATPENWGAIFTIRTGPADFSQALVARIKNHTPYRQQAGKLIHEATGDVVPVPEEEDYFRMAGVAYLNPQDRKPVNLRRPQAHQDRQTSPEEIERLKTQILRQIRLKGPQTTVDLLRAARKETGDFFVGNTVLIPARDALVADGLIAKGSDSPGYRLTLRAELANMLCASISYVKGTIKNLDHTELAILLELEQEKADPRKTLIAHLEQLIASKAPQRHVVADTVVREYIRRRLEQRAGLVA
jgi:hypothetical protein